jgi:hypothetical protein
MHIAPWELQEQCSSWAWALEHPKRLQVICVYLSWKQGTEGAVLVN